MKKILIILSILVFASCSDSPTTAPTKEYPISHKSKAVDLAIKINQIRRLNGLEEFLYVDNAVYRIGDENYVFNDQTSKEEEDFFELDNSYILQQNDTVSEYIVRRRIYLEDTDDLINDLIEWNGYLTKEVFENETTIAINIIERKNTEPKLDWRDEPNWKYNKAIIDFYVYYIVRDYKTQ
jgi:hypothetical protein